MKKLHQLSRRFGFKIVEDASHCIGADYLDKKVGSTQYSDIAVFSFHPVKIITTGEGGMALTNSSEISERLRLIREHGVDRRPKRVQSTHNANEIWNYEQITFGLNYRMSDIQAALGLSQMSRLDFFVNKRRILASQYSNLLEHQAIILPKQHRYSNSSFHLFPIQIKGCRNGSSRNKIYSNLQRRGIGVNLHYIPVYLHSAYQKLGFKRGYCPEAESYFQHAITLPLHPRFNRARVNLHFKLFTRGMHMKLARYSSIWKQLRNFKQEWYCVPKRGS